MSVLVKDKTTGEWIQVAGNGKAEYGASTVRTGTITTEEIGIGSFAVFTITFDTPMPDSDYRITWDWNTAGGNLTFAIVSVTEKTSNGFKLYVRNSDATANPLTSHVLTWYAFKLYTDTEYNSLLDLPDRVSALETVSTMTVTKQGNYINGTNFYGRRTGNVAMIEIDGATGSSIPWGQTAIVGITTGCAVGIMELKCTADMLNVITGYDANGNAITRYIPPYSRSWIDTGGQINVFLANPGSADTSYTKNLFVGGSYITK